MKFGEISPFVRFVRYLENIHNLKMGKVIPLDARLFAVMEGQGEIEVDDKSYVLKKDSVIFINSGVPYIFKPSNAKYIAVNFDFTENMSENKMPIPPIMFKDKDKFQLIDYVTFEDVAEFNSCCVIQSAPHIVDALILMEKEYNRGALYFRKKLSAMLLCELINFLNLLRNQSISCDRFDADEIASYIHRHFTENLNNYKIAEVFHFHPNYISSEFKRHFGKPIHSYILEKRIIYAVSLIEAGNRNITQISQNVGFNDTNYFSRYFKQIIGISPKKYMQKK